jgi:hypothetical protein
MPLPPIFAVGDEEKSASAIAKGRKFNWEPYSFTLVEQVMMGQLRPLNQPSENIIILP